MRSDTTFSPVRRHLTVRSMEDTQNTRSVFTLFIGGQPPPFIHDGKQRNTKFRIKINICNTICLENDINIL